MDEQKRATLAEVLAVIPETTELATVFVASAEMQEPIRQLAHRDGIRQEWTWHPACNVASRLFYEGGVMPLAKEGLQEDDRSRGNKFLSVVLRSWALKHEDKIAIAGLILRELYDLGEAP